MARVAKVSNNKKRQIDALVEQAAQVMQQGRFDVCEQLCRRIDEMQQGNADASSIRGVMASRMGHVQQAIQLFHRAIEAAPRRCEFHANLAGIYLIQGKAEQALESYRRALTLKPLQLQFQLGCASALIALARFDEALTMMIAAHKRQPRNTDVLMKLFRASYDAGYIARAEGWLQLLLAVEPLDAEAHYCYGMLLLEDGRKQDGEREVRETLRLNPAHADAGILLSELKTYGEQDADADQLASMYKQAKEQSPERIKLGFAYGKVLDDLGNYDAAFRCFDEANTIRSQSSRYDQDQELAHLQMVMQANTPAVVQQQAGLDDASPLFIVGMPRCGSTLVEQILGAHPDVVTRGECGYFEEALHRTAPKNTPLTLDAMAAYEPDQWQALGRSYLEMLQAGVGSAARYTDKTLSNVRLIGAIHCALPNACIIHVRRHPLDTCWSIYRHNMLGTMFDYGRNLGQLGYYYRMYQQLMQHWREVLPAGVMYELDYEALIGDQEQQTRQLLDACGLPWDEHCLHFYQTQNAVRTASLMQVRKPISAASIGGWEHYEKQLQPLVKILGVTV